MGDKKIKDAFTRDWIVVNSIDITRRYDDGELTLRALHYQLVGLGMTNTNQHYKRVVAAMEAARWDGLISFETFSDLDREMIGETKSEATYLVDKVEEAKYQVGAWMRSYRKNRWENQPYYPEVFIEKKALQGVFQGTCRENDIALGACKGYPSLTFLYEAAERFKERGREGKHCVILYFGDYDPTGEDIPRSIEANLRRMGADVEVRRFALFEQQVLDWKLPPAPVKLTDSRTVNWDGLGQVELDAVKPEQLKSMLQDAIDTVFDYDRFERLETQEAEERTLFQTELKEYVKTL